MTQPDDVLLSAADPNISQAELFELARSHPQAYPVIAANPQAYPDLLQWLRQVGDPFTIAVLDQREAGLVGQEAYEAARASYTQQTTAVPTAEGDEAATVLLGADSAQPDGAAEQTVALGTGSEADPNATVADMEPVGRGVDLGDDAAGAPGGEGVDAGPAAAALAQSGLDGAEADAQATRALPQATPGDGVTVAPTAAFGQAGAQAATPAAARTSIMRDYAPRTPTPTVGVPQQQPQPYRDYQQPPAYAAAAQGQQAPGQQPQPMYVPVQQYAQPQQASRGISPGMVVLIVLLVLALVAVGVSAYFLLRGSANQAGGTMESSVKQRPGVTQTSPSYAQDTQSPTPSESSEQPSDEVKLPAPQGALPVQSFKSPSGNIACLISDDSARCTIIKHDHSDCAGDLLTLKIGAEGTTMTCGGDDSVSEAAQTLDYGKAATYGDFACTSSQDGVRCWNMKTRHALRLSQRSMSGSDM